MQTDTTEVITKIELFPFLKLFFQDSEEWHSLSDGAKTSHAFMLNRFLAIKHPEYVQCFNKQTSPAIIDALHNAFKTKGKQPGWMYTKTNAKGYDDPLKPYPQFIINDFIFAHGLEFKSFQFALEMHEAEVIAELNAALKVFNQTNKKSK